MSKRSKACDITLPVRRAVYARDFERCVLCDIRVELACANAHFVARSQSGLGIEENILTLCPACHRKYDQTDERKAIRETLMAYLMRRYAEWDERKLYYSKGELYAKNPPDRKSNP